MRARAGPEPCHHVAGVARDFKQVASMTASRPFEFYLSMVRDEGWNSHKVAVRE
jgi:hypothetical protein